MSTGSELITIEQTIYSISTAGRRYGHLEPFVRLGLTGHGFKKTKEDAGWKSNRKPPRIPYG